MRAGAATPRLAAPDLAPHAAGNTGIPYVWSFAGAAPGAHAVVVALTHGNEISGAIALDRLLREGLRPAAGRLTFVFANVAAFARSDPAFPAGARLVDEDLNRLWSGAALASPRHSIELARARSLRPVVEAADFLLDLHSMQEPGPPLMLAGTAAKGLALARRIGFPALVIRDAGHAGGTRLRDFGAFADATSPRTALLLEAGQHSAPVAAEVALATTLRFLLAVGSIGAEAAASVAPLPPAREPQRVIEVTEAVTIATPRFRFVRRFRGLEVIAKAGTLLAEDGERPVRTPYDDCVLVMPSRRLVTGLTAVRLGRYAPP